MYVCAPPGRDSNWDYTPVRALCTNVLIQDVGARAYSNTQPTSSTLSTLSR